jgi:membrane-bound serine protease (ClpP class)
MRRWIPRLCAAVLLAAGVLSLAAGPAGAQTTTTVPPGADAPDRCTRDAALGFQPGADPGNRVIKVVQVDGYLDPVNASLVEDSIRGADPATTSLVVLQVDSSGALDIDVDDLVAAIRDADVPVAAWVGPSGADARGAAALLVQAAHLSGVAPGSQLGPIYPASLNEESAGRRVRAGALARELGAARGRPAEAVDALVAGDRFRSGDAEEARITDCDAPTLGAFIVDLHGREVTTVGGPGPVTLSTARVDENDGRPVRVPNQDVVFSKLPLDDRLVHTLTSPSVALLMLVAGLALVLFEFYTAGIGIAGVTGALALVGSFAGFAHLPMRWWAVALVVLAFVAFAVELQVGTLGPYTVLGLLFLLAGSWWMYGGSERLDPPIWVIVLLVVATMVFIVGGMTAMIRARFSTPTIGRDGLVGELGRAVEAVDPEGIVEIGGARWRALTNRATPIEEGAAVRVVAVDGFALEVEPESGGARDHRERRRSVADAPHPG